MIIKTVSVRCPTFQSNVDAGRGRVNEEVIDYKEESARGISGEPSII